MKINSRFSNDEVKNEMVSPYEDFYTNNDEKKNEMVSPYEDFYTNNNEMKRSIPMRNLD